MPNVLIIVENLPVSLDRRIWQEATTLTRTGYTVSVICPKAGKHQQSYEEPEEVHTALYAVNNDPRTFAKSVLTLLDNRSLRAEKGTLARQRLQSQFNWNTQETTYLAVYAKLFPLQKIAA